MTCPSCGTPNEPGRKFCGECGTKLAAVCAACGTPNPPTARFCGECGTPIVGSPAAAGGAQPAAGSAPPVGGPVAERRLVTVLFADLVGFTALSEGRDPEAVRELLSTYFELATDVIKRYGGSVEKFIGDAVMALWGAPVAHEDDAERAVRAGLDLVDAVQALGPGIQARCGVLTGEAAVTLGATSQGMVAGDLVNTASRLQSVAPAGAVLVGEAVQRATSVAIAYEEAGEQLLKGKVAPVPAWRAVRIIAERRGRGRDDRLEAPFVGRDTELRLLKDLFQATSRERRVRLVSVTGQGGIGKSRLAWEFQKYLDGLVEPIFWHEGRSPSYGEGITFWSLGEMVRSRAHLLETDDPVTTRTRIGEMLAQHVPDEEERRRIEPALLALLGAGDTPVGGPAELFSAWRTFFERVASKGVVVMLFEDLQWADPGTLDFIEHVLEWTRNVPILIVTLARPELLEQRPGWGAGKRAFLALDLQALDDASMRELLGGLVVGLPEAAVRSIVARAEGIPLYAVETIRMLVADGRLREREGGTGYEPVGELGELAVPDTLHALIAARLDGLDTAERGLVQDAATLGQSFTIGAVAAVAGLEAAEATKRLDRLVRADLLRREVDPRSPEQGQYAFVQALEVDGLGPATVRKSLAVLQSICAHAVRKGELTINPVSAVRKPVAKRATVIDPFSIEEVEALLGALRDRASYPSQWMIGEHPLACSPSSSLTRARDRRTRLRSRTHGSVRNGSCTPRRTSMAASSPGARPARTALGPSRCSRRCARTSWPSGSLPATHPTTRLCCRKPRASRGACTTTRLAAQRGQDRTLQPPGEHLRGGRHGYRKTRRDALLLALVRQAPPRRQRLSLQEIAEEMGHTVEVFARTYARHLGVPRPRAHHPRRASSRAPAAKKRPKKAKPHHQQLELLKPTGGLEPPTPSLRVLPTCPWWGSRGHIGQ